MKTCSKCRTEKSLSEFHKDSQRSSGLSSWCKLCKTTSVKSSPSTLLWIQKNKARVLNKSKEWREKNPDVAKKHRTNWYAKNKKAVAEKRRIRALNDPEHVRSQRRKHDLNRKYKLTIEAFEKMNTHQNNKCAICFVQFNDISHKPNSCAVDHDHATGVVRGLLCGDCNRAIGLFKENTTSLLSAVTYLTKHQIGKYPVTDQSQTS